MDDLKDCDFVIECIRYDDETGERSTKMRKEVFKNLEEALSPDAIIATNATTVIISELASDLKHKNRCISLHFMIGHPDAKIIEVVKGFFTSEEVLEKVLTFSRMIKHEAIIVHESNGFVGQRLLVVMLNEACQMLMENICDLESIDKMFQVGFGQRMGVFRLADIIGIEKIVMLMEDMFNEYGDKKYKPSSILWRLYRSKQLGLHSGKGFYIYDGTTPVRANTFN
jgi:3-hydroxybutyryl-CoA dehydrogenase